MYLLDTDLIRALARQHPNKNLSAWYRSVTPDLLYISICTLMEWRKGIERQRDKVSAAEIERYEAQREERIEAFKGRILAATQDIAEQWGRQLRKNDSHVVDKLIAATAIQHDLTVVTINERDFRRLDAKVLNPMKSPIRGLTDAGQRGR